MTDALLEALKICLILIISATVIIGLSLLLGNMVLIVTSNEVAATICTILSIFFFTLFEIILISNLGDN